MKWLFLFFQWRKILTHHLYNLGSVLVFNKSDCLIWSCKLWIQNTILCVLACSLFISLVFDKLVYITVQVCDACRVMICFQNFTFFIVEVSQCSWGHPNEPSNNFGSIEMEEKLKQCHSLQEISNGKPRGYKNKTFMTKYCPVKIHPWSS